MLRALTSRLPLTPAAPVRRFGGGMFPHSTGREHLDPSGHPFPRSDLIEWWHAADPRHGNKGPPLVDGPGGKKYATNRACVDHSSGEIQTKEALFGDFPEYDAKRPIYNHMQRKIVSWGNHELNMKIEYLFFYGPTLIIFGTLLPSFAAIYSFDETVFTTMTVRVVGRQWYWIYEVESPTEDDDDE